MNMRAKPFIITSIFFLLSFVVKSQPSRTDYVLQEKMKLAISYMSDSNYNAANNAFRNILKTEKVLPKNFSYYFSETLYHLGQYKNSHNFLEKYLAITRKSGDFYKEAEHLGLLLSEQFEKIDKCALCNTKGYQFATCSLCLGDKITIVNCHKCKALGIISCQKCKGEGVFIGTNSMGEKVYQSCDRCGSSGIHTCDLCKGETQLDSPCVRCLGSGLEATDALCTHKSP